MKRNIFKSIGAVIAGFIIGSIITVAADYGMSSAGIMDMNDFKQNPTWVVVIVTAYRFAFGIIACFFTAKFAPSNPLTHSMALGVIGTILSVAGAFVMWDQAVAWYNIANILMALPSAWLGGKWFLALKKAK